MRIGCQTKGDIGLAASLLVSLCARAEVRHSGPERIRDRRRRSRSLDHIPSLVQVGQGKLEGHQLCPFRLEASLAGALDTTLSRGSSAGFTR